MKIKNLLLITSTILLCSCSAIDSFWSFEQTKSLENAEPNAELEKPSSARDSNVSKEQELLSKAMRSFEKEVYSIAKKNFGEFQKNYPASYYLPLVELKIADCDFFLGNYTEASEGFQGFTRKRAKHEANSYSEYMAALSHLKRYRGSTKDQTPIKVAHQKFSLYLEKYPSSEYLPLVKESISKCEDKLAEHEVSVANFYFKQSKREAGMSRLKSLFQRYPNSQIASTSPENLTEMFSLNQSELNSLLSGRTK